MRHYNIAICTWSLLIVLIQLPGVTGAKYGVNCSVAERASQTLRPINEVVGRRGIEDCDANCRERYAYGVVCYSDITWQYDVWWWLILSGLVACFFWTIYCLVLMIKMEPTHKITFTPQFIIVFLTILTLISRFILFGTIYNGRMYDAVVGGETLSSFLIQFGQCIMFSEFFLIVIVWSSIVDASTKMRAIDKSTEYSNYQKASIFILMTFIILLPLNILGSMYNTLIGQLGDLLQMIMVISLVGGGVKYALKLRKLLQSGITDPKRKAAVRSIMKVVISSTIMAAVALSILIPYLIGALTNPELKIWVWWLGIHGGEVSWLTMLVTSASQKSRAAYKAGKSMDKYFDTNNNGADSDHSTKVSSHTTSVTNTNKKSKPKTGGGVVGSIQTINVKAEVQTSENV